MSFYWTKTYVTKTFYSSLKSLKTFLTSIRFIFTHELLTQIYAKMILLKMIFYKTVKVRWFKENHFGLDRLRSCRIFQLIWSYGLLRKSSSDYLIYSLMIRYHLSWAFTTNVQCWLFTTTTMINQSSARIDLLPPSI